MCLYVPNLVFIPSHHLGLGSSLRKLFTFMRHHYIPLCPVKFVSLALCVCVCGLDVCIYFNLKPYFCVCVVEPPSITSTIIENWMMMSWYSLFAPFIIIIIIQYDSLHLHILLCLTITAHTLIVHGKWGVQTSCLLFRRIMKLIFFFSFLFVLFFIHIFFVKNSTLYS